MTMSVEVKVAICLDAGSTPAASIKNASEIFSLAFFYKHIKKKIKAKNNKISERQPFP